MACEVCQTNVPYHEQHETRKRIDDGKVATHVNLATCHLKLGDLSKAIEQCTKALSTDRTSMKAHFRRGQAYIRMGDLPKAKDDLVSATCRFQRPRALGAPPHA